MHPVILFRTDAYSGDELEVACEHFEVVTSRVEIPRGVLVVGRYSVLPFYCELENDVGLLGSELINSYQQHRWIADFDWYRDLAR